MDGGFSVQCVDYSSSIWFFMYTTYNQPEQGSGLDNARVSVASLCKNASNYHANLPQFYIVTTWETPGTHWC